VVNLKKKIIFISREFWPNSNGTVACLENFLPLLGKDYDITLYTTRTSFRSKEVERYHNITLKRPRSFLDDIVLFKASLLSRINGLKAAGFVLDLLKILVRLFFFPSQRMANRFGYSLGSYWVRNLNKHIEKHEDLEFFDIIMAVGAPFDNIRSACKVKLDFPDLKLILVEFDLFTDNPVYLNEDTRQNRELRLKEENRWFELASSILVTHEMNRVLETSELGVWSSKVYPIGIPNLSSIYSFGPEIVFPKDDFFVNIVYTGIFYKDIRNPRFSLQVLMMLIHRDSRIRFHILGSGCEEVVREFKSKIGDNLVIHGYQTKAFAVNARYSSDFMWNIGNKTVSQAPSKIMEYIGSCKPIINIYTVDNDICRTYLRDYPLAISIREDYDALHQAVDEIYEFILRHRGTTCSFDDIAPRYTDFLPRTFANKVVELLES